MNIKQDQITALGRGRQPPVEAAILHHSCVGRIVDGAQNKRKIKQNKNQLYLRFPDLSIQCTMTAFL